MSPPASDVVPVNATFDRRRAVLDTLARAFGRAAATPEHYLEHGW